MKMQSFLLSCLTACLLFVFTACSKKDKAPFLYISINPSTGLLDSTIGSTTSFNVSSNIQWKLSVSPASATSWLQLDKTSGEQSGTVKVTVIGKDNSAGGEVVITASPADDSGTPPAQFTVSQHPFLKSNREYLFFEGKANLFDSFTVTSNVQWKITGVPSWLQVDTTVRPGGTTLVKVMTTADNNDPKYARVGFTVMPVGNSSVKPLVILVDRKINWHVQQFSPTEGPVGTEVTLTGVFADNPKVYLSGVELPVKSSSGNQIVVTIPATLTLGNSFTLSFGGLLIGSTTRFTLQHGWNPKGEWQNKDRYTVDGTSFVYNGSIYFGLGKHTYENTKGESTIYKVDINTFTKSPAFTIPAGMSPRSNPFSFVLNNKVYIGGGKSFDNKNLHDVWELDPATGAWRQMTSLPNSGIQNMGYTHGTEAFVQSLQDSQNPSGSTMYSFSVNGPTDPGTWSFDRNISLTKNLMSVFTLKNVGWFGGGYDINTNVFSSNFYRYSPYIDGLVSLRAIPEAPGDLYAIRPPAFSTADKGYILSQFRYLYEYDPVTDNWTLKTSFPDTYPTDCAIAVGNRIFAWNGWGNFFEYLP